MAETRESASEAERIGRALLDLSARLPDGYRDDLGHPGERGQADLYVAYEAGDECWEIEFTALDFKRNTTKRGSDLAALIEGVLNADRKAAPDA